MQAFTAPNPWRDLANCRGKPSALFFPDRGSDTKKDYTPALRICSTCPVWAECLEYAMETRQGAGVWGGHTFDDRLKLRKARLTEPRTLQTVLL